MKRIVIGVCAALLLAVLSGSEASAVSPNNTTVTASGPPITDIENNVWAITPNRQITENGRVQPATNTVNSLFFFNNAIYQNAHGVLWFKWEDQTGWVEIAGDPRINSEPTSLSLTESIQFDGCCIVTRAPSLPTIGTRTYSGIFIGARVSHDNKNTSPVQGRVTATVNFATDVVVITFVGLGRPFSGSINENNDSHNPNFFTIQTLSPCCAETPTADGTFLGSGGEEMFGTITGSFGGVTGFNLTGTFTMADT